MTAHVKVCVRRPRRARGTTVMGLASENLHKTQTSCSAVNDRYSISSSAAASSVGDGVIPSFLAVFMLTTSVYLTACSNGSSPGFAP